MFVRGDTMSYRIEYDRGKSKYEVTKDNTSRFSLILTTAIVSIILFTLSCWPEGAEKLKSVLIPGEDMVTVQAFQTMKQDLLSGASIEDSVEAFCKSVIHGK